MFRMDISESDGWLVLLARGDLDLSTAPSAGTALQRVPATHPRVVVDLSAVDLVDGTGLGLLVALQQRLHANGGRLVLASCPPPLLARLHDGGLGHVLECVDSLDEVAHAADAGRPAPSEAQ